MIIEIWKLKLVQTEINSMGYSSFQNRRFAYVKFPSLWFLLATVQHLHLHVARKCNCTLDPVVALLISFPFRLLPKCKLTDCRLLLLSSQSPPLRMQISLLLANITPHSPLLLALAASINISGRLLPGSIIISR